jgi:hypothetical protein
MYKILSAKPEGTAQIGDKGESIGLIKTMELDVRI